MQSDAGCKMPNAQIPICVPNIIIIITIFLLVQSIECMINIYNEIAFRIREKDKDDDKLVSFYSPEQMNRIPLGETSLYYIY